jgi:RHH-type rel operon transcriptional repressor/antitoxin RelB
VILQQVKNDHKQLAQGSTGRTKTFYVREAILKYLDNIEDMYLAEKRLADIRAGRSKPIPLKDVMKRYELED